MSRKKFFKMVGLGPYAFDALWVLMQVKSLAPRALCAYRAEVLSRIVEWYFIAAEVGLAPLDLFAPEVEGEVILAREQWDAQCDFGERLRMFRHGVRPDKPLAPLKPHPRVPGLTLAQRVAIAIEMDRQAPKTKDNAERDAKRKMIQAAIETADIVREAGLPHIPDSWCDMLE